MASRSRLPVLNSSQSHQSQNQNQLPVPLAASVPTPSLPTPAMTTSITKRQPIRASQRAGFRGAEPPAKQTFYNEAKANRKPLGNNNSANRQIQPPRRAGSAPPMKTRPIVGISNGRRTPDPETAATAAFGKKRTASGKTAFAPLVEESSGYSDPTEALALMDYEQAARTELKTSDANMVDAAKQAATSGMRRGMIAAADELDALRVRHQKETSELRAKLVEKDRELDEALSTLRELSDDIGRERDTVRELKGKVSEKERSESLLQTKVSVLETRCEALATEGKNQLSSRAQMQLDLKAKDERISILEDELQEAETLRRKLHNQIQELKGNIRVFCRVRPPLPHENNGAATVANMAFPDRKEHREIVVSNTSETATGGTRDTIMPFAFDRVFEPASSQEEVFEEISHLTQSCIDGYNVCIFAYGQTGSGKSFTMEGGQSDDTRGMIPRAVRHVFDVANRLKQKGWTYKMEGQFLEIYNETIVDLLGKGADGKHEIKHDKNGRTTVTDAIVYPLQNPNQVQNLLAHAQSRRTVHATLMNERSSRSHSVFTLRITGHNEATGETCEGSLNLVDLAGSERLEKSGAMNHKDRLKETQAINKSLSALGDVIAALGEKNVNGDKHIPYRNSKLTYLLQNSLSGNSKTLMFVNVSPLAAHLGESICSLRFATKVNNTTLGTARKQQGRSSS